jgi:uncharacterized OB-fold protein
MGQAAWHTTGADAPYWQALSEGRLKLQKCSGCSRWHWPAVWRCGDCGGWALDWHELSPEGRVFSYSRTWHPFAGSEGIGQPYVSLIVELPQAGGRRVLGLLEGPAEGLRIGATVRGRATTTRIGQDDIPSLSWTLAGGGAA